MRSSSVPIATPSTRSTPLEFDVLSRRFGLQGRPQSMKELAQGIGCSHAETRDILGGAIDKLRTRLTETG